jgi:hypothetical protein
MQVRIELLPDSLDGDHAAPAQDVAELTVDQLDAAAVRLGAFRARVGLERALEVVHQRKQLLDHAGGGRVGPRLALAFDALPVVIELGRLAEQQVVVLVPLPLQLGGVLRAGHRIGCRALWIVGSLVVGCVVVPGRRIVHERKELLYVCRVRGSVVTRA